MRHTMVSSHPQGMTGGVAGVSAAAAPPPLAPRVEKEKPPIPPRNSSIRLSSTDAPDGAAGSSVKSKIQMFQQSTHGAAIPPPPSYAGMLPSRGGSHAGNLLAEEVANRSSVVVDGYSPQSAHNGYGSRPSSMIGTPPSGNRTSADGYSSSGLEDSPPTYVAPPLPSQPPPKPRRPDDSDSDIAGTLSDGDQVWRRGYSKARGEDKVQYREKPVHARGDTPSGATVARHASLPGSGNPPPNLAGNLQHYSATLDHRHQRVPSSEGSSEGDYGDKKSRDRKKGVLSLFRKR